MNDETGQRDQTNHEPPLAGDEAATLLGFLERQRSTFAWKTGVLDKAGLRATLAPPSMTLGGLPKHLARFDDDMSTEWLHGRRQLPPWNAVDWDADPDWDWNSASEASPEEPCARWCDAVVPPCPVRGGAEGRPVPAAKAILRAR